MKKKKSAAKLHQIKLTAEEREIAGDVGWKSAGRDRLLAVQGEIESIRDSLKQERVNARFSASDIEALKRRAAEEGIPYQTLLGSIVHKYITGQLIDVESAKAALQAILKKHG